MPPGIFLDNTPETFLVFVFYGNSSKDYSLGFYGDSSKGFSQNSSRDSSQDFYKDFTGNFSRNFPWIPEISPGIPPEVQGFLLRINPRIFPHVPLRNPPGDSAWYPPEIANGNPLEIFSRPIVDCFFFGILSWFLQRSLPRFLQEFLTGFFQEFLPRCSKKLLFSAFLPKLVPIYFPQFTERRIESIGQA